MTAPSLPIRRLARWASALALALVLAAPLAAQPASLTLDTRTCATPEPTLAEVDRSVAAVEAWLAQNPGAADRAGTVTIPIAWHIITNGSTGAVSQTMIDDQMQVLNDAFLSVGFQFTNAFQQTVNNATWYNASIDSAAEAAMKNALALDPAVYLNMYTGSAGGLLGWATFPDAQAETDNIQGVVMLYSSLPGGSSTPYNLGDTATHEIGHYIGLFHTFQGGCSGSGDGVADTPAVASPNFGCPAGTDSCPGDPGLDLIDNFMDYVDDDCMDSFTPGQVTRALALMNQFRPTIMGGAADPAQIAVSPGTLSSTLAEGATASLPVTISNTAASGASDLTWTASVQNATSAAGVAPTQRAPRTSTVVYEAKGADPRHTDGARGTGGPDTFGYTWSDSDEAGGPAFAWVDISGSGTAVALTDDNASGAIALPFAFPFYGTSQSQVYIGSNGYLTFGTAGNTGIPSRTNQNLPDTADPDGLIAMYWDDLNPASVGAVHYQDMGDGRFIVQFTGVPHFNVAAEASTFQAILYDDGQIDLQYLSMTDDASDPNSHTIGIENTDGSDGLAVAYNTAYVADNLAVRIAPPAMWISVAPSSGSVTPGASGATNVALDATGLADGVYTADLVVASNDPANASVTVPVTLTVSGGTASVDFTISTAGAYVLSSPQPGVTVADLAALNLVLGVPGYAGTGPNLRTAYDGTKIWSGATGASEVLQLGMGFQWILTGADRDYGSGSVSRPFPTTLSAPTPNTTDVLVPLEEDGFRVNIYGNPFGAPLDITAVPSWPDGTKVGFVWLWDVASKRWLYDASVTQVEPWQAFFIRTRPGRTGTLTIPAWAAVGSAAWAEAQSSRTAASSAMLASMGTLRFDLDGTALDGAPLSDGALAVVVGDDIESESKLRPLSNAYVAAGFSGAEALGAIEALRADGGSVELPIAVTTVGAEPDLVLRWDAPTDLPATWTLTLIDRRTGATADLSTAGSYAFRAPSAAALDAVPADLDELPASEATERFALRIDTGDGAFARTGEAGSELALASPVPNPSRGAARVAFSLAEAGTARLSMIDALGREVTVLVEGDLAEGAHAATVDTARLAAGVYVLRLEAGGQVLTQRATVVR